MTITEQLAEAKRNILDVHRWIHANAAVLPRVFDSFAQTGKLLDAAIIVSQALAAYEASKATPAVSPLLWCCHVRGPDDVHPAPDYQTALKWSDMINDWSYEANARFEDEEKVMSKAAPALWPWSPESHAQNLAKAIADFSPRLPVSEEKG